MATEKSKEDIEFERAVAGVFERHGKIGAFAHVTYNGDSVVMQLQGHTALHEGLLNHVRSLAGKMLEDANRDGYDIVRRTQHPPAA